jgi:hypothetical protein
MKKIRPLKEIERIWPLISNSFYEKLDNKVDKPEEKKRIITKTKK